MDDENPAVPIGFTDTGKPIQNPKKVVLPTYSQINEKPEVDYNSMQTNIYGVNNGFDPNQNYDINQGQQPVISDNNETSYPFGTEIGMNNNNYTGPENINAQVPQQPISGVNYYPQQPQQVPQTIIISNQPQPQPIYIQPQTVQIVPIEVHNVPKKREDKGKCYCLPPPCMICYCGLDPEEEYHCCVVVLLYILCILSYISFFLCIIICFCAGSGRPYGGPPPRRGPFRGPHGGPHGHF